MADAQRVGFDGMAVWLVPRCDSAGRVEELCVELVLVPEGVRAVEDPLREPLAPFAA